MIRSMLVLGVAIGLLMGAQAMAQNRSPIPTQKVFQVVCNAGQQACGNSCYSPASGQTCHPGGVICSAGLQACGASCYSPASGQTCHPGGLICSAGLQACGQSCYNPAAGQTCHQ